MSKRKMEAEPVPLLDNFVFLWSNIKLDGYKVCESSTYHRLPASTAKQMFVNIYGKLTVYVGEFFCCMEIYDFQYSIR